LAVSHSFSRSLITKVAGMLFSMECGPGDCFVTQTLTFLFRGQVRGAVSLFI
jgi:hypothetical protein